MFRSATTASSVGAIAATERAQHPRARVPHEGSTAPPLSAVSRPTTGPPNPSSDGRPAGAPSTSSGGEGTWTAPSVQPGSYLKEEYEAHQGSQSPQLVHHEVGLDTARAVLRASEHYIALGRLGQQQFNSMASTVNLASTDRPKRGVCIKSKFRRPNNM